jgi:V/A-type H+-transporting ATPase subunit C
MKSRLLTRRELEALAEAGSLQGLISSLAKSVYHKSIEMALVRASGLECLVQAFHMDMIDTLGRVRNFYTEDAGKMAAIALRPYDVHNLKTVLRGLARNVTPAEIIPALLPVGDLKYAVLADLARAPGSRAAIDMLVSMNEPLAKPLIELRLRRPGAEIHEMELVLDQWHYREAIKYLQSAHPAAEILGEALKLDADIENLLVMLRFVRDPEERRNLQERLGGDLTSLLVAAGRLPHAQLVRLGSLDNIEAAVESLESTRFGSALQAGLQAFKQTGRLSEFETRLKHFRLSWLSQLIYKDTLGIGVFLGYLALKINEINNLRWVTHGINLGLNAGEIKAELELAA